MNIKSKLVLIRGILYLHEIIRCKSITKAAEENNIKASNLSKIINELETEIDFKLLHRTPLGCTATMQGNKIATYANQINNILLKINPNYKNIETAPTFLKIYISPYLELKDYTEFENKHPNIQLTFTDKEKYADIKITNQPPLKIKESYTELNIGKSIKQKIWISCNDQNHIAMAFYDFIIAKLLLLYD